MTSRSSRWAGVVAVGFVAVLAVAATTWALLHYRLIGQPEVAPPHFTSPAIPKGTQVITVVPVDANGQAINGFRQLPPSHDPSQDPGRVSDVFGCTASPAAVADDIYYCVPNAAGADVCWPGGPSTPGTLWCLTDPWDKGLRQVASADPLPHVLPPPTPAPFALLLDDGTQCRLRNGGAWGARDDGLVAAYGCPNETPAVLMPVRPDGGAAAIDRSQALWTVKVGSLGAGNPHLPPPQTRTVVTAWFAGN